MKYDLIYVQLSAQRQQYTFETKLFASNSYRSLSRQTEKSDMDIDMDHMVACSKSHLSFQRVDNISVISRFDQLLDSTDATFPVLSQLCWTYTLYTHSCSGNVMLCWYVEISSIARQTLEQLLSLLLFVLLLLLPAKKGTARFLQCFGFVFVLDSEMRDKNVWKNIVCCNVSTYIVLNGWQSLLRHFLSTKHTALVLWNIFSTLFADDGLSCVWAPHRVSDESRTYQKHIHTQLLLRLFRYREIEIFSYILFCVGFSLLFGRTITCTHTTHI